MNLIKNCRTCLQQLLQEEFVLIAEAEYEFLEVLGLNLNLPRDHPEVPKHMCLSCFSNLMEFKNFYEHCLDATEFLESRLDLKSNEFGLEEKLTLPNEESEIINIEIDVTSSNEDTINTNETNEEYLIEYFEEINNEEFQNETEKTQQLLGLEISDEISSNMSDNNNQYSSYDDKKYCETSQSELLSESENKPYKCKHCGKRFKKIFVLRSHENIHNNIKPFTCDICGKSFRQKNVLNTHQTLHFGKAVECLECGKKFARKSQLILHNRMHRNEKPFKCNFENCLSAFRQKQHLIAHKQIHSGVKNHQCPHCTSIFYNRISLQGHIYSVHSIYCYECKLCEKTFCKPFKLRKHLQSTHNIAVVTDVTEMKKLATSSRH